MLKRLTLNQRLLFSYVDQVSSNRYKYGDRVLVFKEKKRIMVGGLKKVRPGDDA